MKIRFTVTVDIDPKLWDETYGTGTDQKTVREDVLSYMANHIAESPGARAASNNVRVH